VAGRATKANPDKENGIWWNASGREMLQRWVDWRTGGHGWKLWRTPQGQPAIELGITVNFGSVPVKMHIDRVFELPTGDLCILDLKTGSRTPSSDLQLAFYAVGMELALGVRPKFGTYWMAREGNTSALTDLGFYTAEMLTEMVEQFDKARKASIFVPNSNHCKLCDLTAHCKYYNNKEVTK
jgi:RecB family exonuclease